MRQTKYHNYIHNEAARILCETWLLCCDYVPGVPLMFKAIIKEFDAERTTLVKDEDLEPLLICFCWQHIWLRRKMLKYKYAKSLK